MSRTYTSKSLLAGVLDSPISKSRCWPARLLVPCRRHHHTPPPSRQSRQSTASTASTMPCASADDRTLQQSGHEPFVSEQGRAGRCWGDARAALIRQCVGCGCNVGRGTAAYIGLVSTARVTHSSFAGGGPRRLDQAGRSGDLLPCQWLHGPVTHQRRVGHELHARSGAKEPADFWSGLGVGVRVGVRVRVRLGPTCIVGRLGVLHVAAHRTVEALLPVASLGVHVAKEVRTRRHPLERRQQGQGAAPATDDRHAVEHAEGWHVGEEDVNA
eukprot:scaffold2066_cov63-Phaeocystis_antarctica.AAC.6